MPLGDGALVFKGRTLTLYTSFPLYNRGRTIV